MFIGLTAEKRFSLQVRKKDGCWAWRGSKDKDGYGIFDGDFGGVRYTKAHRFSYAFHTGEDPALRIVCHSCDTPECTNPDHLFLGTHAINMADKIAKGRARVARGETGGHAKITEAQALTVLMDPRPYVEIAGDLGIAVSTVTSIKNRQSWRHLPADRIVKSERRGKHRRGVSDKLTEADIRLIRSGAETGKALAERFGVSVQTICDIRKRRSWAHIT
jgi:hypothetical protein